MLYIPKQDIVIFAHKTRYLFLLSDQYSVDSMWQKVMPPTVLSLCVCAFPHI